jgi:MFS family permease
VLIGGLLKNEDFRRLWAADALSQLGTRISVLAVPLMATTTLNASAFEVASLRTLQTLAYLVLGLQVGAWCDRLRLRRVLIVADLGRAATFASVPLAAAFGALTIWQLFVVVTVAGVLTVFFDVAHQSYLPRLLPAKDLVEGNARLQTNVSVAAVAGPSAAGGLIQLFGGPVAILANAAGYLWSALLLGRIRKPEPPPERAASPNLRREIGEGLRLVFGHPALRALGLYGTTVSLFQSIHIAISVVFLSREIHLSAGAIGLVSTTMLLGALVGALTARKLGDLLGPPRVLWFSCLLVGFSYLLNPLTGPGWALTFYVVAGFGASAGIIVFNVHSVSFQQAVTPEGLRGRMSATMGFLMLGATPVGSLLGGVLATALGLRATLWVAAIGVLGAAGWLLLSPLRKMRELPV